MSTIAASLRGTLPPSVKRRLRHAVEWAQTRSIRAALKEQKLVESMDRLERIAPDLSSQYTEASIDSDYLTLAVRALHAFQMSLADDALALLDDGETTVVDIGDSAGTHLRYLSELHPELSLRCLSVNVDPVAVARIRAIGREAIEARAEDLTDHGVDADLFLSYETLEHLEDPIRALRDLSYRTTCQAFVVTVPYVRTSRVGLYQIRAGDRVRRTPEATHIFELSPEDWRLLFRHTGWEPVRERLYLQYPRRGGWRLSKPLWSHTSTFGSHEGFWGAILRRDHSWSDLASASATTEAS